MVSSTRREQEPPALLAKRSSSRTRQRDKRSHRRAGNKNSQRCSPNDRKRCQIRDRSHVRNDIAAVEATWASPSCFRIRVFKEPQRPAATLPQFKYATSPGRSCRPGRLESDFCDSPSRSLRGGSPMAVEQRSACPCGERSCSFQLFRKLSRVVPFIQRGIPHLLAVVRELATMNSN